MKFYFTFSISFVICSHLNKQREKQDKRIATASMLASRVASIARKKREARKRRK
jgi:hypothetical protein